MATKPAYSAAVGMVPLGGQHGGESLVESVGLPGQATCSSGEKVARTLLDLFVLSVD